MDYYEELAEKVIINKIRSTWFEVSKMYNEMASKHGGTMSMGFVLLTVDDETGTPVTKIAPRMGMEPNSLSRVLKSMEKKGLIYRSKDKSDKRKVYIKLTDYGREMRKLAFKRVYDFESKMHEQLDSEKIKAFFEVVNYIPEVVKFYKENDKD